MNDDLKQFLNLSRDSNFKKMVETHFLNTNRVLPSTEKSSEIFKNEKPVRYQDNMSISELQRYRAKGGQFKFVGVEEMYCDSYFEIIEE